MAAKRELLCFFGHHKCASTWIHNVLDAVCADAGWRLSYLYAEELFGADLAGYVARSSTEFLSYVNADVRHVRGLGPLRGFHVVRDPRDLVVSSYFSHRGTHPTHAWPELAAHREKLRALGPEEGLLLEMDFSAPFLDQIASWDYGREDVLELKQEELTRDPYRSFLAVFEFLGVLDESHYGKARWPAYLARSGSNILHRWTRGVWPRLPLRAIPGERLLGAVFDHRFQKYAGGREKGEEDRASHYRRGVGGDWVRHFTEAHVARFKERFGDLPLRLGYESDPDWSVERARRVAAST